MAQTAARRKSVFDSRRAAATNFRHREVFRDWNEQAFDGYIECGFVGDGEVRLACRPEIEADIYRAWRDHDTWDRLGSIEIPVLIMAGELSDTITPEFAREQADQFAHGGVEIVTGTGHFLPMERPGLVAERVRRLVALVGG